MGQEDFDLFGYPVDPKTGKPGRPSKRPSAKDRNVIKGMLAEGKTVAEMCCVTGLSEPTFRKYFLTELQQRHAWRLRARAEAVHALMEEALKNRNMSAMRLLLLQLDKMERADIERALTDAAPKEKAAGKKVERERMAGDADADLMQMLEAEARSDRTH